MNLSPDPFFSIFQSPLLSSSNSTSIQATLFRSIKESFSRWWMLDATEDHMCIAGSFNLAVQLPSSSDFTGGAAMALCSSHIRSPEPELSGLLQRTLLTSRPTSSWNINSKQSIRLIRARQFTAVSNAISWQIVIASNDSLISDVALNSDALQNGPIHHR